MFEQEENLFDAIIFDFELTHSYNGDEIIYLMDKERPKYPYFLLTDKEGEVFSSTFMMDINKYYPYQDLFNDNSYFFKKVLSYISYYRKKIEMDTVIYEELISKYNKQPTIWLERDINDIVKFLKTTPCTLDKRYITPLESQFAERIDKLLKDMDALLNAVKEKNEYIFKSNI